MGLFTGLGKAAATTMSGAYVKPGKHLFEICKIEMKDSQSKKGIQFFVCELKVLETTSQDAGMQVGRRVACVWDMSKLPSLGNVRNLMEAIDPEMAVATDAQIEAAAQELVSADQPATGVKVRAEAVDVPIKSKPGQVFTKVVFFNVPVEAAAETTTPAKDEKASS